MSSKVETPFPIFTDIDGSPLEDGYIYVGTAGLDPSTNGITVYSDADLSTVVAQPIRTKSGFPVVSGSPIRIYTGVGNFSLRVANKNNSQVLQDLNAGASVNIGLSLPDGSAAAPSLSNTGDSNTGLYWSAADELSIATGGVQRAVVDSSGNLGVGAVPSGSLTGGYPLRLNGGAQTFIALNNSTHSTQATGGFVIGHDANRAYILQRENQPLSFSVNNTEAMRLDASGRLGLGTSSPRKRGDFGNGDMIIGDTGVASKYWLGRPADGAGSSYIGHESTSDNDLTVSVSSGGASIKFYTALAERMRLDASGNLLVGKTATGIGGEGVQLLSTGQVSATYNGGTTIIVNRLNNDGELVSFRQDSVVEGSISVSGTTVSYNGGHLARWSRMLDGSKPENLLKGTVMSNLDEMIEWAYPETPEVLWAAGDGLPEGVSVGDVKVEGVEAIYWGEMGEAIPEFAGDVKLGDIKTEAVEEVLWGETDGFPEGVSIGDVKVPYKPAGVEDNEQLNHTAISSVEGDRDVAGVFIAWDDDDDYNDYHLAMAGDVIIRIAEGVEVKRGDLLISAGDGTAKPQDDDLIRSSTVAKVTSTVVSCTYDDGSFCVPCVLK